jgi:hypothetical protein
MSSIFASVSTEQLDVLRILAEKMPALHDVIDPHDPLVLRFSADGSQFESSAPGISTTQIYTAPDLEVHLTGITLVNDAAYVIA